MGGHEYQDQMKNVGLYTHPRNCFIPLPPFTLEPRPKGAKATTVFLFPNYLMPENNHRNDWILDLFGGPNEAGKYEMKVSLFRPESQKLTESWFVFIPFRYRSNDVSKKSRGLVGRGLGWRQVGSIPPISNFIPLPSHQEVYCISAGDNWKKLFVSNSFIIICYKTVSHRRCRWSLN